MNRIQLLDQHSDMTPRPTKSSVERRRKLRPTNANHSPQHSFFVPMHYEPNYAYPLLVWLHGRGETQRQLRQVMPHVSMRNYVGVAPVDIAPEDIAPEDTARVDIAPGDTAAAGTAPGEASKRASWPQDAASIAAATDRVIEAVEQASTRFHIARHRVFLAGFDTGGTMALRIGLAAPQMFAGVASLGGPFPQGHQPLSRLAEVRRLPILIAHGRDSQTYPVGRVCDELRLFHVAGMSLNLRQYPCEHELTTQMLGDLDVWLMEIVTGHSCSASSSRLSSSDELN
jgi:phospholipase/carboxylesterase